MIDRILFLTANCFLSVSSLCIPFWWLSFKDHLDSQTKAVVILAQLICFVVGAILMVGAFFL